MEYSIGQKFRWVPVYFKWDVPAEVEVTKTYPRGWALMSNNKMADEDGYVHWFGKVVGRVEKCNA